MQRDNNNIDIGVIRVRRRSVGGNKSGSRPSHPISAVNTVVN